MIGLLFHWERGWAHPWFEIQVWDDLAQAYNVDRLFMIPDLKMNAITQLDSYDRIEDFLDDYRGLVKLVFLIPRDEYADGISLKDYKHPETCIYLFGASWTSLVSYITEEDDVVAIDTPVSHQIWQYAVAGAVLYDRLIKQS